MHFEIKNIFKYAILIIIIALISNRFFSLATNTTGITPFGILTGYSMTPALNRGDIVIWTPTPIESVRPGDIIVFESKVETGKIVTHRAMEITKGGIYTKGDANPYYDQWGAHAVEPAIKKDTYLGKVISIGAQPVKIPFIGNIMLYISSTFIGKPEAIPIVPLIVVIGFCMLLLSIHSKFKKPEKKKFIDILLKPEKLDWKKIVVFLIIIYVVVLSLASASLYDTIPVAIGVEKKADMIKHQARYGAELMHIGDEKNIPVPIMAPRVPTPLPYRVILIPEGEFKKLITFQDPVFTLLPGGVYNTPVVIYIPKDAEEKVYTGNIYVHSSIYWSLIPESFVEYLLQILPQNVVMYLDLISSLILSVIAVVIIITISKIIDYYYLSKVSYEWGLDMRAFKGKYISTKKTYKLPDYIKKCYSWLLDLDIPDISVKKCFINSLICVIFIPLALIGYFEIAIFISAFSVGILAYRFGARWRSELILSGIFSTLIIIVIIALQTYALMSPGKEVIIFLSNLIASYFLFLVIILIPVCFLSYLGGYLLHHIKIAKNPFETLELSDI